VGGEGVEGFITSLILKPHARSCMVDLRIHGSIKLNLNLRGRREGLDWLLKVQDMP
jgi:hypothetical protein